MFGSTYLVPGNSASGLIDLEQSSAAVQDLMLQGLDKQVIEFTQLESALSEMQFEYRQRNRFRQLALLVIARLMPKSELKGIEELFAKLDIDHDGHLTVNELRQGLHSIDSEVIHCVALKSNARAASAHNLEV